VVISGGGTPSETEQLRTSILDEFKLLPRIFAYVRVSTTGQTTENQIGEIEAAGFAVEPRRIVSETISGGAAAAQRRGFIWLMDKLEAGDILVVTKLDRLGRNAMDVRATVNRLAALGVRVHFPALGGADTRRNAAINLRALVSRTGQRRYGRRHSG
jgi:putative DNA-invertase from lambdoid prophage Rac